MSKFLKDFTRRVNYYSYLYENKSKLGLSIREYRRLFLRSRFKSDETLLFGNKVKVPDATTFLNSVREIFVDEIYKFETNNPKTIIDCGANVGLSAIYFKRLFPS